MKTIDKIIVSSTPPKDKNVAWFDGKGIKIPNQGEWKSTGGSGGGSGIEIVESVDKLDPNAPVGSVAVVFEEGSIQEVSVLDLPQPDASIINTDTFIMDASGCPQASGISIIIPEGPIDVATLLTESEMLYFASSEVDLMGGTYGVIVGILPVIENNQIVGLSGMYMDQSTKTQKQYSFFTIQNGAVEINQYAIDECNSYMNGLYYVGAVAYTMQGMVLSKEQLEIYDKVLKVEAGIPSKAHVYLKENSWEELYKKDFVALQNIIDTKSDIVEIKPAPYDMALKPNIYYAGTNSYVDLIKLIAPTDTQKYNEYILELKCTKSKTMSFVDENGEILSIKWANGVEPTFEAGITYLISIANSLGVFTSFIND